MMVPAAFGQTPFPTLPANTTLPLTSPLGAAPPAGCSFAVCPDSPIWGLKVAIQKIGIALSFSPNARASAALDLAQDRLAEVQQMINAGKPDAASSAQQEDTAMMQEVQNDVQAMPTDSDKDIQDQARIKARIDDHANGVAAVSQQIQIRIATSGVTPTPDQQQKLLSLVQQIQQTFGSASNVHVQIQVKEDQTKVKIIAKTGVDPTQLEIKVKQIENQEAVKVAAAKSQASSQSASAPSSGGGKGGGGGRK